MHSILIVEDERIVAKDLQHTLKGMGYDAFAIASSADEALRKATERCPDLVLMDIRIKGERDGIEAAALLRGRFAVPIVYLTAHADEATLERAKLTEPYGYLMKPVRSAELRSMIEVSVHKHQMELRERNRERSSLGPLWSTADAVISTDLPERLASLGTLAAGLAHEVNNPLAIVLANASYVLETLREPPGHGDPAQVGDAIQAQVDLEFAALRIARIVAKLQAFSRQPQSKFGETDVGAAVDAAVRATAPEFRDRGTVVTSIPPESRVKIDELRLGQVLVNLLVNAAHATPPGAGTPTSVTARVESDTVVIEVRDAGCGMAADVVKRIFEPFYTTKPIGHGLGLGLAVCHGIVRSVAGRIEVDSQLGRGSTFRVTLPLAVEPVAQVAPAVGAVARRGRVLVIDDEPVLLQTFKRTLRDHDVVCLDDARQVVGLLDRGEQFDLILSDLMMPNMTGMQLYETLLAGHPNVASRIVFVTGGVVSARVADFLAVVPNPCLQKPVPIETMRDFVRDRLAAFPVERPARGH